MVLHNRQLLCLSGSNAQMKQYQNVGYQNAFSFPRTSTTLKRLRVAGANEESANTPCCNEKV